MKEKLQILYGEYLQLYESSHDYMVKRKYKEKMLAIEVLLSPIAYKLDDPILDD